jgi:NADH-quinone oxidoreductase subunit H
MIEWFTSIVPPWFLIGLVAFVTILGSVAYLILLERKVASWVQDRLGPNRVGLGFGLVPALKDKHMFGLGQPMADGLKFFFKEDYRPKNVDKVLFTIAPGVMMIVMVVSAAALPWGGVRQTTRSYTLPTYSLQDRFQYALDQASHDLPANATIVGKPILSTDNSVQVTYQYPFQAAELNIGVLFILAFLSLAVYGIVVGGWASNNKYSFLGGLRATASMISYEIPLGLSVLCIVLMFGTLDLNVIVEQQAHYWLGVIPAWNVFTQPVAFTLFLICIHAEANRAPFDLAEAEQELVGGYHTEYSSMRFALFFLSEYAGMITTSAVCVALFFGGWHLPWIDRLIKPLSGNLVPGRPAITDYWIVNVIRFGVFFAKTIGIIFVFMWVRWSLPRFRFDQLMMIAWRGLIPISLGLLVATAVVCYWFLNKAPPGQIGIDGPMALALLAANGVVVAVALIGSRLIPAAPATNRRLSVAGSRFGNGLPPAAAV